MYVRTRERDRKGSKSPFSSLYEPKPNALCSHPQRSQYSRYAPLYIICKGHDLRNGSYISKQALPMG